MVDIVQVVLLLVVSAITVVVVIIGIQIYKILREVQRSLKKVNQILGNFKEASEAIAQPFRSISEFLAGTTGFPGLLGWLINRKFKKKEGEKSEK